MWAKQSTAATLIVGPILDSTGAEYTSAVIGDLSISKNGGTLTALASAATLTHIANGQYTLVMTTGNLDTLGRLQITCNKSTYQMPPIGLNIVPAMVFDSMVLGTDVLQSDVTQFGGTAGTFSSGRPEVRTASVADNALTAAALATDAVTEIQSGLATQTSVDAIQADTNDIQTRLPAALDGGRIAAVLDSAAQAQIDAIETLAARITTGIVQDGAVWQFTANMLELGPANAGGGDATLAKQEEILAAIQGSEVIQVASPNVSGNLVLTQGDDYDGTANPRAQWTVTTDYTSGWTVALTIRDVDDAVVYTTAGTVVSATVVAVTIAAPTGLTMTGCPGQWQGKFDVQLTHTATGKKKTIALGVCYINEDQTR